MKSLDLIKRILYWISGNGKNIKVWEDSILGETTLGSCSEIDNIKLWLLAKGATSLWDLSAWDDNLWLSWDLGDPPPDLHNEAEILTTLLQGKAPIKEDLKDRRGWGNMSGKYSTYEGYKLTQAIPTAAPNPAIWKFIWSNPFIPKIDFFCWTLAHKSILSGENLKNKVWKAQSAARSAKMKKKPQITSS